MILPLFHFRLFLGFENGIATATYVYTVQHLLSVRRIELSLKLPDVITSIEHTFHFFHPHSAITDTEVLLRPCNHNPAPVPARQWER